MKSFTYIIYNRLYKPILKLYLKSDSSVRFEDFKLKVFKDVFHPKLFFSTKYFYSFIKTKQLENLKFLEIGSGSGILSMLAYKKGAHVTTIDIDKKAVENTRLNFSKNFTDLKDTSIIESNLFSQVPKQLFDFVIINPPYYFKKVETSHQYAWYCGENGEYFETLFLNLKDYTNMESKVFMILEENCEIERIQSIAGKNKLKFELVDERKIRWEKNYIYAISMN